MRVAYVHDWLVTRRGGEKVLRSLLTLHPDAPIFTLFYDSKTLGDWVQPHPVHAPRLLRPIRRGRRALLPILPTIMDRMDFSAYDLIISSSSCVAKGARPRPGARHVCYIHSPMRYIWDQAAAYRQEFAAIPGGGWLFDRMVARLRRWDQSTVDRVSLFAANSTFVAERVRTFYQREAVVVHPPVDVDRFAPQAGDPPMKAPRLRDYALVAGAFVPYKRFDLAIQGALRARIPLVVAGSGPGEKFLRSLASPGDAIRFVTSPSDHAWRQLMQGAAMFLQPGIEDFGIAPVEALAAGTPIVVRAAGGARDYWVEGVNGIGFEQASPDAVATAMTRCQAMNWDPAIIRQSAQQFREHEFLARMRRVLDPSFQAGLDTH